MENSYKYTYEYSFLPFGSSFQRGKNKPNEIWLDIGSSLEAGAIDHHNSESQYPSTVDALLSMEGRQVLSQLNPMNNIIRIYMHRDPDIDALFSTYLTIYYLENDRTFPLKEDAIREYVSAVDTGKYLIDDNYHNLYALITGIHIDNSIRKEEAFQLILELVKKAVDRLHSDDSFSLFTGDIAGNDPRLCSIAKALATDADQYQDDLQNGRCFEQKVRLPYKGHDTVSNETVKALIWKEDPSCHFHKMWARKNGYQLTVIPQRSSVYHDGENIHNCTNVIISLNPVDAEGNPQKYSLMSIVKYLEEYEQECELNLLGDKCAAKRNRSRPRGNTYNLFYEPPFVVTGDPWFINASEDLVAAPGSGSLLSMKQIIDVVNFIGECHVKSCSIKTISGFTFDGIHCTSITRMAEKAGWTLDESSMGFIKDLKSLNYMLREFSDWSKKDSRFHVYKNPQYQEDILILYQYGVGLLINDTKMKFEDGKLFHSTYETLHQKYREIIHSSIDMEKLHRMLGTEKCDINRMHLIGNNIFTSVDVDSALLNIKTFAIDYYAKKLCNFFGMNDDHIDSRQISSRVSFSLSSRGCVLLTATDSCSMNKIETEYRNTFESEWFYLYLTALQQRYLLMEINRDMVAIGCNHAKKIRELKETLITFTASGYFSNASDDEMSEHLYKMFLNKMEVEVLKENISNHLSTINEYNDNHTMRLFNLISYLALPLVILSTVFQTSIIHLQPLWSSGKGVFGLTFNANQDNLAAWGMMLLLAVLLYVILILNGKKGGSRK